ncbi:MAG: energy transducer TonB [Ignavibacteriaceae bacterium]|nr:energy transducer TonB [Ignavibacteriaceae bacterium]
MTKLSLYIYVALLTSLILFNGCSASNEITRWSIYYQTINKDFSDACLTFSKNDYLLAKEKFTMYNKEDTTIVNFESFAFLAECYRQLGNQDSGKIVYKAGLIKLESWGNNNSAIKDINDFRLDTLKIWDKNYPEFPNNLNNLINKVEFIPQYYDEPVVIHAEAPIYPEQARKGHIEGEVFVKILINSDGLPIQKFVIITSNKMFNEASIEAVKAFKFSSHINNKANESWWYVIPFRFRLN